MTEPTPLRLFLDRSTQGRRFVEGVWRLVDDARRRYGAWAAEGIPKVQWSADGRIPLGAGFILPNPLERRAICRARARYVVFGTNNLRVPLMIELFVENLVHIRSVAEESDPWVYRIAQHGFDRLTLNCDQP